MIIIIAIVNLKETVQWKENVIWKAIFPKEKEKKFILEFYQSDESWDVITISILSLTNTWKIKQLYPNIFGSLKIEA